MKVSPSNPSTITNSANIPVLANSVTGMIVVSLGGASIESNTNNPTYETPEASRIAQSGKSSKLDDSDRNMSKSVDASQYESFGNPKSYCYCSPSKYCINCDEKDNNVQ